MPTAQDIDNRFTYHKPDAVKIVKHEDVRNKCKELAHWINENIPEGREKALSLTALQEASLWANTALACNP